MPIVNHGTKFASLDKNRLIFLYESERMPLARIAAAFGVSDWVVKRALKLHRIAERPRLKSGGKYFDRMCKLIVGESVEIECPAKYAKQVLRITAHRLDIKVAIRHIGSARFRITRIEPTETPQTFEVSLIDKKSLEEMYCERNVRLDQIAANFDCGIRRIRKALKFYKIAQRPRLWGSGKYSGIFKTLELGETVELECLAKHPQTNLHNIANRIGIKISVRRSDDKKFRIKRIG